LWVRSFKRLQISTAHNGYAFQGFNPGWHMGRLVFLVLLPGLWPQQRSSLCNQLSASNVYRSEASDSSSLLNNVWTIRQAVTPPETRLLLRQNLTIRLPTCYRSILSLNSRSQFVFTLYAANPLHVNAHNPKTRSNQQYDYSVKRPCKIPICE